jgi:P4 family phage/plasmid primase-like protien
VSGLEAMTPAEFLRGLYAGVNLADPATIPLLHKPFGGQFGVHSRYDVTEVEVIASDALTLSRSGDVWWNICPVRHVSVGRGLEADVAVVPGLWADIDTKVCEDPIGFLSGLREHAPTVVVWSGNGAQAYWLFNTPVVVPDRYELPEASATTRGELRALNERWRLWLISRGAGQLDAVQDLARIFRLPGTVNWKDPTDLKPVRVVLVGKRHLYDTLLEATKEIRTPDWVTASRKVLTQGEAAAAFALRGSVLSTEADQVAQRWAEKIPGWIERTGSRNKALYLYAQQLNDHHLSQLDVEEFTLRAAQALPEHAPGGELAPILEGEALACARSALSLPPRGPALTPLPDWAEVGWTGEDDSDETVGDSPGAAGRALPWNEDERGQRNLTESGNALRLVDNFGSDLRWVLDREAWLLWDGRRWAYVTEVEVMTKARLSARMILVEAAACDDVDRRGALTKWAVRSESAGAITAAVRLARADPRVHVKADDLDQDRWLLCTPSGVVDLRTGELKPARREDLITRLTRVGYEGGGGGGGGGVSCGRWLAHLEKVLAGSGEMMSYLQRALGYSLTGDCSEQVFFIMFGRGANGKSVTLHTISDVLGDYGHQAAPDLLLARRGEPHPTEQAELLGKRFVVATETQVNRAFDERTVKALTGQDKLRARFMRRDFFTFIPEFKLWMAVNDMPRVRDTSVGFWRRVQALFFGVQIPEGERVDNLQEWLVESEGEGILRWLVDGCREWQRIGLLPPEEVIAHVAEYREEQDRSGEFFTEHLLFGSEAEAAGVAELGADWSGGEPFARLWTAYVAWCDVQNIHESLRLKEGQFRTRLRELGCKPVKVRGSRAWTKVYLRSGVSGAWDALRGL